MSMRSLSCVIFGLGHRWEMYSDAEGSVTTCRRCGKLRHLRAAGLREIIDDAPGDPIRSHAESKIVENTKYLP